MITDSSSVQNQPIDQEARDHALDITRSFAVSAPAGSGKTGLLTQRVLALLAQCEEPENILAITFTRKAASEMQARILEALHYADKQTVEPKEDYEKITWHLAQAVLKKNREQQWQLFHCPNRLRITTIDSFCRSLSQQMPFESKLGDTPEILDNVNTAYQLAARETLKRLNSDNEFQDDLIRLVKHFDNKLDKIEQLFIQLLAKRDQWIGVILETKDQRDILESILNEVIEEHFIHAQQVLAPIGSELAILADHAGNNIRQDLSNRSYIKHCAGMSGLPLNQADHIKQWLGVAELLLTQKGELRKNPTKAIGFFAPSDKSLSKEQQDNAKVFKQRAIALFEQCRESDHYQQTLETTLHGLRSLPSAHYDDKQWELLDSLTNVLIILAQHLTIAFQQLGKADYLAVTLAALDALGQADQPTDLALALDYKIQHVLVDEFQDTSSTQLELLKRLTAGWQTGDGRTLFVVGDAMQSCYRFRDANVGIFLNVREHGLDDIDLESLDLQTNFRSQKNIVDWVNQSFSTIFPRENNSNRGAVSYNPSTSIKSALNQPAVQAYLISHNDKLYSRKDEAKVVTQTIHDTQKNNPDDTIAILVRSKSHAQDIITALQQTNIAYQANDIDKLNTCMPVLDILSLTKALLFPNDRMAWLAILRAPWCGLDMHDILAITEFNKKESLWALLSSTVTHYSTSSLVLSPEGKSKFQRFAQVITAALAQQKRHSLRHWIQGTWLALGGTALLTDKNDLDNIYTFFSLLDRYEQGGNIPQWDDLEKAVNDLFAKQKNHHKNPVQIMSIHKSKGLEFDSVIIPGLDKTPPNNDKELLVWLERTGYSTDTHRHTTQLLVSPVNASGDDDDQIYRFIRQQHKEKEQLESDRVLYVGCTRAIKNLHLIAYTPIDEKLAMSEQDLSPIDTLKTPNQQSLLHSLWPSIKALDTAHCHILSAEEKNIFDDDNSHSNKLNHPNMIVSLSSQWQAPTIQANTLLAPYRGNNILAKTPKATTHVKDAQEDMFATPSEEKDASPERQNMAKPDELLNSDQRHTGTVIHQTLEHIAREGIQSWQEKTVAQKQQLWRVQLQQKGLNHQKVDQAITVVQQAITNTLSDKKGQWILDNTHQQSATELELWNKKGQHIIDRTFIDIDKNASANSKTRWIIDYKSSQPIKGQTIKAFSQEQKQQHQAQLQRYKALFKYENNPIRAALYFPLIRLFLEL